MWSVAALGGAGFMGFSIYDAARSLNHYQLARRIEKAEPPKQEGEAGFAVFELSSSAHKVNGFVLAKITKRGGEYDVDPSDSESRLIRTSSSPLAYALQTHWKAHRSLSKACFEVLASASLLSISRASKLFREEIHYMDAMSRPEGLRFQEGEVPHIPRPSQRVNCTVAGFAFCIAATYQFQRYWNLGEKDPLDIKAMSS